MSFDEAQDLLIDWCDLNQVTYMPDKNKQEYGIKLYGFLVDYSDGRAEWLGDTYCYAWVNSFTKIINFEEAGYSESTNTL